MTNLIDEDRWIDKHEFGLRIRDLRRAAGYRSAKAFQEAIEEKAGYCMSATVLNNIECGRKLPSIIELMAMSLTLDDDATDGILYVFLSACTCKEWREISGTKRERLRQEAIEKEARRRDAMRRLRSLNPDADDETLSEVISLYEQRGFL